MELTKEQLAVGKTYRAKRYRDTLGFNNNRTILWIGENTLQYDSHTVKHGRHYPKVTIEQFLRWAKCEVIEEG